MKSFSALHPQHWNRNFYWGTAALLLAINLFGPQGLIHGVLLRQEAERLKNEKQRLGQELQRLRFEISRFQRSETAQARVLREELGLLQGNEISVEILNPEIGNPDKSW